MKETLVNYRCKEILCGNYERSVTWKCAVYGKTCFKNSLVSLRKCELGSMLVQGYEAVGKNKIGLLVMHTIMIMRKS
jgi:hypothetical protein